MRARPPACPHAQAHARGPQVLMPFYELFTGPASHILDRWFESE